MSYTPTNWQTGDTITADRLNNMEGGIASANEGEILHITATEDASQNVSFSVPAAEAWDAVQAGKIPVVTFLPYGGGAFTLFGRTVLYNGINQSIVFYNKNNTWNSAEIQIVLNEGDWGVTRTCVPDLEWITQYNDAPNYRVLGLNHTDQLPSWETVEYPVLMGTLVSPLILAACNAAVSGKTTLAANFSGGEAYQLYYLLISVTGYVGNGRGAGLLLDLDTSTHQRVYARVDSIYGDEPDGKDIQSASFRAKILPTATGYYEISCFSYAENDEGVYSGYFSVTAEKIEPTFVPMS